MAFRQTLEFSPKHQTARILLDRVKLLTDKREAASRAVSKNKVEEAVSLYSQALQVDPANKKVRLDLLVERGSLYLKQKKSLDASQPCECEVGKQSQATTWQSLKISSNFLCNFYPLCIF